MKKTSCGVILTDGEKMLGVVPYGNPHFLDIPKGMQEPGEEPQITAARELREETGITVDSNQLYHLGEFNYNRTKDLILFIYKTKNLPPLNKMRCSSYFENVYRKTVPEVIGYKYVPFDDITFYRGLQPILQKLKGKL